MKVVLTWTDPTTRVDGAPLPASDIAEVGIHHKGPTGPSDIKIGAVPPGVQTFTTDTLEPAAHDFWVVTTNTSGNQSGPSNVVSVMVLVEANATPAAVTDLAATLVP
jgi:hypothetical protein